MSESNNNIVNGSEWVAPTAGERTGLKVVNNLTLSKVEFVPIKDRTVYWYTCGPTVYDASHMGHARNYVTFDILRRIMEDYLSYNIVYIENVTDVDDKIIIKTHKQMLNSLVESVRSSEKPISEALDQTLQLAATMVDKGAPPAKFKEVCTSLATQALEAGIITTEAAEKYHKYELDFTTVARKFEAEFFQDMTKLQVKQPDIILRVTEHIPEIVAFIEKIIENGYAYESNGSVYFDCQAFRKDHTYRKLEPWSVSDEARQAEGEGALSTAATGEKKFAADFALWKKSKEGEPSWESKWGMGRPGWHIECSAMASTIAGEQLDIHSGGVDLKFPHHDNELAQSEAYFRNNQWVNYFLHSGHLNIDGCKMSKSLKNFITIKQALEMYTARQIRTLFLLHKYDSPMDFSASTMEHAVKTERMLNGFFLNMETLLREWEAAVASTGVEPTHKPGAEELELHNMLVSTKTEVHNALLDNFNTPVVMHSLSKLITATKAYISKKGSSILEIRVYLIKNILTYITHMLRIFGLIDNVEEYGFSGQAAGDNLTPFLNEMSNFRDTVRQYARNKEEHGKFLDLCGTFRDEVLPTLGVRLEDRANGKAIWKLEDREALMQELERKKQAELEKQQKKEEEKRKKEEEKRQKEEKAKVAPQDMFKVGQYEGKYSQYDDQGVPTHDNEGKEVTASGKKKLQKLREAQAKLHNDYLTKNNNNN